MTTKNKKIFTILALSMIGSVILSGALSAQPQQRYFDIIICLDDRLADQEQIGRDKKLILQVFEKFKNSAKQGKFYIHSQDAFRILTVPQRGMPEEVNNICSRLVLDLAQIEPALKRRACDEFGASLSAMLDELYRLADQGERPDAYNGSNIWRFFNGSYPDEMKAHQDRKACIYLLTDGYIDFEVDEPVLVDGSKRNNTGFIHRFCKHPNWEKLMNDTHSGLMKASVSLDRASVTVLELKPKCDGYFEAAVLKKLWQDWLGDLGCASIRTLQKTRAIPALD